GDRRRRRHGQREGGRELDHAGAGRRRTGDRRDVHAQRDHGARETARGRVARLMRWPRWRSGPRRTAPERIRTERLVLRRPTSGDAAAVFERFASDADVTRYLSWRRHESVADTAAFLRLAEAQWARGPAGPYLIESRATGELLGSTGFACESDTVAEVGYVLAKDAWGFGYATEALRALVAAAPGIGLVRVYGICHTEHTASAHVLEKSG